MVVFTGRRFWDGGSNRGGGGGGGGGGLTVGRGSSSSRHATARVLLWTGPSGLSAVLTAVVGLLLSRQQLLFADAASHACLADAASWLCCSAGCTFCVNNLSLSTGVFAKRACAVRVLAAHCTLMN